MYILSKTEVDVLNVLISMLTSPQPGFSDVIENEFLDAIKEAHPKMTEPAVVDAINNLAEAGIIAHQRPIGMEVKMGDTTENWTWTLTWEGYRFHKEWAKLIGGMNYVSPQVGLAGVTPHQILEAIKSLEKDRDRIEDQLKVNGQLMKDMYHNLGLLVYAPAKVGSICQDHDGTQYKVMGFSQHFRHESKPVLARITKKGTVARNVTPNVRYWGPGMTWISHPED